MVDFTWRKEPWMKVHRTIKVSVCLQVARMEGASVFSSDAKQNSKFPKFGKSDQHLLQVRNSFL